MREGLQDEVPAGKQWAMRLFGWLRKADVESSDAPAGEAAAVDLGAKADDGQMELGDLAGMSGYGVRAISARQILGEEIDVESLSSYSAILRATTSKLWASWKACDIVAQAVADTKMSITRAGVVKPVTVPELVKLMEDPNANSTWWEMIYLTTMWLKLVGNAYWYKANARADGSRPTMLQPINPGCVRVVCFEGTSRIRGYIVSARGESVALEPHEVIHFKRPHPNDAVLGLGDIEAGMEPVDDALRQAATRASNAKNGSTPSSILVLKGNAPASESEWEKIKRKWDAQYAGSKNSGKMGFLAGDWQHFVLGMSPQAMQALEHRRQTTEELFHLHGVPLSVAGVKDAANYATAEIDMARFRSQTVLPMVRLIGEALTSDLVRGYGPALSAKFEVMGLVNVGGTLTAILPAFDRGIVSPNEVREMIGLAPLVGDPLMDGRYINSGLVPIELAGMSSSDPALTEEADPADPEEPTEPKKGKL